jgi:DNA-binding HxlR family transcriptional regulator
VTPIIACSLARLAARASPATVQPYLLSKEANVRTGLLRGAEGTKEIAPRVLSRELKALAQIGLIARKDYGVVPPKVEYRLTPMGQSFVPVIATIQRWGMRHLAA